MPSGYRYRIILTEDQATIVRQSETDRADRDQLSVALEGTPIEGLPPRLEQHRKTLAETPGESGPVTPVEWQSISYSGATGYLNVDDANTIARDHFRVAFRMWNGVQKADKDYGRANDKKKGELEKEIRFTFMSFDLGYGVSDKVELTGSLPILLERINETSATALGRREKTNDEAGIGDLGFGGKWHFYESDSGRTHGAFGGLLTLPTGEDIRPFLIRRPRVLNMYGALDHDLSDRFTASGNLDLGVGEGFQVDVTGGVAYRFSDTVRAVSSLTFGSSGDGDAKGAIGDWVLGVQAVFATSSSTGASGGGVGLEFSLGVPLVSPDDLKRGVYFLIGLGLSF